MYISFQFSFFLLFTVLLSQSALLFMPLDFLFSVFVRTSCVGGVFIGTSECANDNRTEQREYRTSTKVQKFLELEFLQTSSNHIYAKTQWVLSWLLQYLLTRCRGNPFNGFIFFKQLLGPTETVTIRYILMRIQNTVTQREVLHESRFNQEMGWHWEIKPSGKGTGIFTWL